MFEQLAPFWLHRCQRYLKSIGCEPLQLPGSAWSVSPLRAVPEMVGGDALDGAVACELAPAPAASPSRTTIASVPAIPSVAPRSAERFFAASSMVEPPSSELPSGGGTPPAAKSGAVAAAFYRPLTKLFLRTDTLDGVGQVRG